MAYRRGRISLNLHVDSFNNRSSRLGDRLCSQSKFFEARLYNLTTTREFHSVSCYYVRRRDLVHTSFKPRRSGITPGVPACLAVGENNSRVSRTEKKYIEAATHWTTLTY